MIYLNSLPNLLAVLLLLIFLNSCAIQPTSWSPPLKPEFKDKLALNEKLSGAEKIPLRGYYGAEEFAIDKNGNIFCGVHIGENDFSAGASKRQASFLLLGSGAGSSHYDQESRIRPARVGGFSSRG